MEVAEIRECREIKKSRDPCYVSALFAKVFERPADFMFHIAIRENIETEYSHFRSIPISLVNLLFLLEASATRNVLILLGREQNNKKIFLSANVLNVLNLGLRSNPT